MTGETPGPEPQDSSKLLDFGSALADAHAEYPVREAAAEQAAKGNEERARFLLGYAETVGDNAVYDYDMERGVADPRRPDIEIPKEAVPFGREQLRSGEFSAVVFDLYGTLVDVTNPDGTPIALAAKLGVSADEVKTAVAKYNAKALRGEISDDDRMEAVVRDLGVAMPEAGPERERFLRDLEATEREAYIAGTVLFPGVVEMLRQLRRDGFKLALCSNAQSLGVEVAKAHGLLDLVDAAVFSAEAHTVKPAPKMYAEAYRQLDVAPGSCLYADDGMHHSIEGAMMVGMQTVLVQQPGGYAASHPEELIPARFRVDAIADLVR